MKHKRHKKGIKKKAILTVQDARVTRSEDHIIEESPLEIRLRFGSSSQRETKTLTITMRTPGHDQYLATGLLLAEGIITHLNQILTIRFQGGQLDKSAQENSLLIELKDTVELDWNLLNRQFASSAACGVCGKTSLDMLEQISSFPIPQIQLDLTAPTLFAMMDKMRSKQNLFSETGGVHAAGLFQTNGKLISLGEDVGRHNAVDKCIGKALQHNLPTKGGLLCLSGRAGFELVQKAYMAGIQLVASVGAPSSLAIEVAEANGMILIGFMRGKRFNIYCGQERLVSITANDSGL